ncbi:MAG: laccase domain-containing protein, partial [Anaerolineales bacterium]|nr:laccase domain-containing protein [Anaerolineales bacterium]
MGFQQHGALRYWTFDSLDTPGLAHAIFTRQGGHSPAPWQALNVGGQLGDTPERVEANRHLAFTALARDPASLYDVWQVHGAQVVQANAPRPPGQRHLQADAILTDQPQVTLFMRFADCVPILLYDPVRPAIGL